MKRIFIALAILLSVSVASNAQVKSVADAKKAVEAAKAASENDKKASKVATWIKLGQAYYDAYVSSVGDARRGQSEQEFKIFMSNAKPTSQETVVLDGTEYVKNVYPNCNYYFNNGILEFIEVTEQAVPDALDKAVDAYAKAKSIDNGSKSKDITDGIKKVSEGYVDAAVAAYTLGDFKTSSKMFGKVYDCKKNAPTPEIDSLSIYNSGYTAMLGGDDEAAKKAFTECMNIGYYNADGEVFAKLAELYGKSGDTASQIATLEKGFKVFPQSQSILFGLINYYVSSNSDPEKLFTLLDEAKKNEPNNPSLYYVEGNIHKQLGDKEAAIASYEKASEMNPSYEYGYVAKGMLLYDNAVEISQKAAEELDDAKYEALAEQVKQNLLAAMDPFEKAFEITKDDSIKTMCAEYLKNIYYRFASDDEKYKASYEKYNSYLKGE